MGSSFSSGDNSTPNLGITPNNIPTGASLNNKKNNATPVNNKKNAPAPAANAPAPAPAANAKTGGKRHRKRRGGMASLKAFDTPRFQPSDAVMQRATTAGGSRKHKGGEGIYDDIKALQQKIDAITRERNTCKKEGKPCREEKNRELKELSAKLVAMQSRGMKPLPLHPSYNGGSKTKRNNRKHSRKHNRKTNKKQHS